MHRPLLLVSALFVAVAVFAAQEPKTDNKTQETKAPENKTATQPSTTGYQPVPVAAAREANPVKATPESIAAGKKIFRYDCALCHGDNGDGKGDASKDMKVPNLTDPNALKDRTDGEIFYRIKTGHGDMPPEGNRVKAEQLWDMVNYVRSLSKKGAAPAEKPATDEKPADEKPTS